MDRRNVKWIIACAAIWLLVIAAAVNPDVAAVVRNIMHR
jgi:hypothetical protein